MGKIRKKGRGGFGTQTGENHTESGKAQKANHERNIRMGMDVPDIVLGEFDTSYLQMLSEIAGKSEESKGV